MKKALSLILALTLTFALLPTFAYAETTEEASYNWEPVVFDFGSPTTPATVTNGEILKNDGVYDGDKWKFVLFKGRSTVLNANERVKTFSNSNGKYIWIGASAEMVNENNNIFAIAVDVPASGIYDISANVFNTSAGAEIVAAIQNQPNGTLNLETAIGEIENTYTKSDDNDKSGKIERVFSEGVGIAVAKTENFATAGHSAWIDNLIKLTIKQDAGYNCYLYDITFTPSTINSATVAVDTKAEYEIGAAITPTVALNVKGIGDKVYSDLDMAGIVLGVKEDNAGVTVENNVYKATASGEVTFTPTVTVNGNTHDAAPVTISVAAPAEPEQDEELSDAFDDAIISSVPNDYIAPSVDAIDAEGVVGEPVPVSGGAYEITAPETAGERGNFLYWKKAMSLTEKIVSFERKFNYVPESKGRNILVAVYEGDVASTDAKCYNANGQYLPDAAPVDADLPSMAGYGKANAWAQYGNTNVYVAQYEAETPIANIDVTVIGDNTSGGGTNLAFGAPVTCKATGENFKCWKKIYGDGTAKIVSRDAEYTFKAWEDCTVEAVYEASVNYTGSTLKIIIDSFTAGDETGVMAEFLGLGNNVVEKGIMFGNNRIAMTTVGNQFSVIADEPGTYKGYVIVEETDGLKLITDGFYEHN